MRASRLLQILLLLQNRGRMTAGALAAELEVAHRTILRDMDALTEAGLPVITYQGNQGGFELGFSYRTRLTGLAADEAEALAVLLDAPTPRLAELGMADAGRRVISKLRESLPDQVRAKVQLAREQFRISTEASDAEDPRIPALAAEIRGRHRICLRARSATPQEIHPLAPSHDANGWSVLEARTSASIGIADWHDLNISSLQF
jgi:predicted DNA-binding transcriptional regulator YafY